MTVYNSLVSRADLSLPEDKLSEIFSAAVEGSAVLPFAKRLRDARSDELKMRVNAELPIAYFVDEVGKTSTFPNSTLKQTTAVDYNDTTLYIREIATIVPIPQAVWNDADFNVQGDISTKVRGAISKLVDASILSVLNLRIVPMNGPLVSLLVCPLHIRLLMMLALATSMIT